MKKCQNIVVMAGAGISTPSGIPDFRSVGQVKRSLTKDSRSCKGHDFILLVKVARLAFLVKICVMYRPDLRTSNYKVVGLNSSIIIILV